MLSRLAILGLAAAFVGFAAPVPRAEAQIHLVQRCDTNLRIANTSSTTVTQIRYNPTGNSAWGPNRLGTVELYPNQSMVFRLGNEVPYDFRIVWATSASHELRNVDICRISQITITNQGMRIR